MGGGGEWIEGWIKQAGGRKIWSGVSRYHVLSWVGGSRSIQ